MELSPSWKRQTALSRLASSPLDEHLGLGASNTLAFSANDAMDALAIDNNID
jgi:hypothetical protein